MVTTTKTTAGETVKRNGKAQREMQNVQGRGRGGTGAGTGPQSLGLGLGSGSGLFHMYMASVVSMCLNTHLFIQIWPTAAATATAAGETIKQVGRQVLK